PHYVMHAPAPTLTLTPIGVVHSPWRDKHEAPRQPAAARGVAGQIELYDSTLQLRDALSDLETWSHIWVVFWFHLNHSFRAKVQPPRSLKKRGVYSTRSPHRPNPLGLSVLRLERVEGRMLHVSDLDILHGTPVFDIKPYVPYTDAVPDANSGWLGAEAAVDAAVVGVTETGPEYQVEFSERASEQLAWLNERTPYDVRALAQSVLRAGPAPHAYRRIRVLDGYSRLGVKDFRVHFRVQGLSISVFEITSGYRKRVLADPRSVATELTPLWVHREFMALFGPV
ncbi:MAG: hypothetical protein RL701_4341, partial [Pseudomonadota bacterium]